VAERHAAEVLAEAKKARAAEDEAAKEMQQYMAEGGYL